MRTSVSALRPESGHLTLRLKCPLGANSGYSLDHLVGAREQRGWDGDAEHLRGLEVDDEFEPGGELNWQMRDRGAFEYFIYKCCGAVKPILKINSIANKPARFYELAISKNGREPSCRRGSGDISKLRSSPGGR